MTNVGLQPQPPFPFTLSAPTVQMASEKNKSWEGEERFGIPLQDHGVKVGGVDGTLTGSGWSPSSPSGQQGLYIVQERGTCFQPFTQDKNIGMLCKI